MSPVKNIRQNQNAASYRSPLQRVVHRVYIYIYIIYIQIHTLAKVKRTSTHTTEILLSSKNLVLITHVFLDVWGSSTFSLQPLWPGVEVSKVLRGRILEQLSELPGDIWETCFFFSRLWWLKIYKFHLVTKSSHMGHLAGEDCSMIKPWNWGWIRVIHPESVSSGRSSFCDINVRAKFEVGIYIYIIYLYI